jgi:phosphoribosylamine--glycine ligase
MKVLVIGGGGREHALVWELAKSPEVDKVFCAPGNPGMAGDAELVDISADDLEGLLKFAQKNSIDLTVVGPEAPLVAGISDMFEAKGLLVAGPSKYAAQLEGSKSFAKDLMSKYNVPTAACRVFVDPEEALAYVARAGRPLVVKADGLCAGKGVILCKDAKEAEAAVQQIMVDQAFGEAGAKLVIEEWLRGEEATFMVFTDGETIKTMPTSQDHKAVGEGDTGPNTGGMGAYSPAPVVTPEVAQRIMEQVIEPVINGLREEGHPYKGVLYAGLMIDGQGNPQVLEFNVRFGDPECQPLMMRHKSDLALVLKAVAEGRLHEVEVKWRARPAVCVVMASEGYPGSYDTGKKITGLDDAATIRGVTVFHAGTKMKGKDLVTAGGRVLGVSALGEDMKDALARAYDAVAKISWKGAYFRRDIGHRALDREEHQPQVAVIMGSASDWDGMRGAVETLRMLEIRNEVRVLSAHRTPGAAVEYASTAAARGIKVIIAGAGWAAHLAGAMAAHSILPVIGVPMGSSPLNGMDALLATVQMPAGIPVGTVAIGSTGAKNAAYLAAQILALSDEALAQRLVQERKKLANKVLTADQTITRRALAGEPFFE